MNIMTTTNIMNNRTMMHSCFSSTCLEQVAQELSRVFQSRAQDSAWCISSGRKKDPQDRWQGLVLVKGTLKEVLDLVGLCHTNLTLCVLIFLCSPQSGKLDGRWRFVAHHQPEWLATRPAL